jgi:hypothetical protein
MGGGFGCRRGRTRACAGLATCSLAGTLPARNQSGSAHRPYAPSRPLCFAWRESTELDYQRVHGELQVLDAKVVAAFTVWRILKNAGIDPVLEHSSTMRAGSCARQDEALLAV